MLDYAANGLEYWSIDRLRQDATETARNKGRSIETEVGELIGSQNEADIENFWKRTEENLRTGKVRLVFVADETSKELRRLVEFLNNKMDDVEVLAVEIKQFLGEGKTTLVPRTIGLTEANRGKKGQPSDGPTNRKTFLEKCTNESRPIFEKLLVTVSAKDHSIYWGVTGFSMRAYLPNSDKYLTFAVGFPANVFKLAIRNLVKSSDEDKALRKSMANWGFSGAGEGFVKTTLDNTTALNVYQAFDHILDKVAEVISSD